MKKYVITLFAFCFLFINTKAQVYEKKETGITLRVDSFVVNITFYSPEIVRIVKYPIGNKFTKESLSVISVPKKIAFTVKQQKGLIVLKTEKLQVHVEPQSGEISYYSNSGMLLLNEKKAGATFTPFNDAGNQSFRVGQIFQLEKDEPIYGLGQQQRGKMSQRNAQLRMVQNNTEDYVPFFQSVKGYGIFWDNYSPTTFTDNETGTTFKSDVGDGIDYYFLYGTTADGVIAQMRFLTGNVPMFPLWTYGFWQSKERYKSQNETVEVVKKYRDLGVPLDGIIQDWQYWGSNYLWNAMEFLNADFGNPQQMVNDIHGMNARMIISIWNSFGPHTKQYRELDSIKALMNFTTWPESGSDKWPPDMNYPSGVRVYDPYHPAARDIYWKYLKQLHALGIDGWWMDSSEPDHLRAKPSDLDNKTYLGSFRKVRNAFPLMTVGGVYDNQRKTDSAKRVFILTRSAFAGQQRYGANTWTGDVVASWTTLRNQISAGLNFSLTGIPHWNSDIGGFFLWNFKHPLSNADYKELYVRWLQFGAFTPMMRSHGADAPREIYQFGKRGEKHFDAIEKYINLRYTLLPYIYSTSWDVTANHSSFMRGLVMDFPKDKKALDINDTYMFGKSILVNPVTESMYTRPSITGKDTLLIEDFSKVKMKETYLPDGHVWYDFWSNEKFPGGITVKKQVPLDIMPLYVKAGAIIPLGPQVQYAEEKKWEALELRIYPGANGSFVLYEDENDNYNYEKGIYSTILITWNDKSRTLTINDRKGSFPGMLNSRQFKLVVANEKENTLIKTIHYTGTKITVKW